MKLKDGYVLRKVAQSWVAMSLAEETLDFNGVLTLNDSGAMLWHVLEKDCSVEALTDALMSEYKVSKEQASADAKEFLNKLISLGCVEV